MWEPVLDHPLFMILPLIAPLFTKFYDSLSGFHCPPSFVLGPKAAAETFPQLDQKARGHPWPEPRLRWCRAGKGRSKGRWIETS